RARSMTTDSTSRSRWLARYADWLHLGWPSGTVERLPAVDEEGRTRVPGLYVVGDLAGIPLLKFSSDTGARAVARIAEDAEFQAARARKESGVRELVVIGGGVSGFAAAMEARKRGIDVEILEAA